MEPRKRRSIKAAPVNWPVGNAEAQWAPGKTVRLVIPFPPGGASDILGRLLAQQITAATGQGMLIENRPAASVLIQHDAPDTLHFIDPPYMPCTRDRHARNRYYRHELTECDHFELLGLVKRLEGMVVLSGYHTELYDRELAGWARHERTSQASGNRGTVLRTEVVWLNPQCQQAVDQANRTLRSEPHQGVNA